MLLTHEVFMRRFAVVLLVLGLTAPLQAKDLRPLSLRELTYRAGAVVLADPVAPAAGRFKVTHVFRGPIKVDAAITLTESDRNLYTLATFATTDPDNPPPAPLEALLFLAPTQPGQPAQLVSSGLFLCMPDGVVLAPRQQQNPGPFVMTPQPGRLWANVVRDAQAAAGVIDAVMRLKTDGGKERTPRLLAWVEQHRLEFGGGFYDGERAGWGSLETDVFDWICTTGTPAECWAAQRLYAELNHGAVLPLKGSNYGTPAGRDFLLQLALNQRVLDGDRARAVALLAHPRTLASCNSGDLDTILQKLPPLLGENSDDLRGGVIAALRAIRSSRGTEPQVQLELQNALPALEKAYKAEKPGAARDQLVEVIHSIGGADHWKEFSGSKAGVAALLRDFDRSADHYYFWLQVLPAADKVYERPSLVLERLDAKGNVAETKTLALPATDAPKWEDGWTPGDLLLVQFPPTALRPSPQPGGPSRGPQGANPAGPTTTWRVSVRGTIGKDKIAWTSEPKLVVVRTILNPDEIYPYPIEEK